MGLHFCAANGNCPPLFPRWRTYIYIYRKGEEGEKIVRLYGDVTIFRFLSSILSLLLLYSFFFTPQEGGFLSLFLSYNFFFVSSYFILLSLYFHYFILLCFFYSIMAEINIFFRSSNDF